MARINHPIDGPPPEGRDQADQGRRWRAIQSAEITKARPKRPAGAMQQSGQDVSAHRRRCRAGLCGPRRPLSRLGMSMARRIVRGAGRGPEHGQQNEGDDQRRPPRYASCGPDARIDQPVDHVDGIRLITTNNTAVEQRPRPAPSGSLAPRWRPPGRCRGRVGRRRSRPSPPLPRRKASSSPNTVTTGNRRMEAPGGLACNGRASGDASAAEMRAGKGRPRASRIPERMMRVSAAATPRPRVKRRKDHVRRGPRAHRRQPGERDGKEQDQQQPQPIRRDGSAERGDARPRDRSDQPAGAQRTASIAKRHGDSARPTASPAKRQRQRCSRWPPWPAPATRARPGHGRVRPKSPGSAAVTIQARKADPEPRRRALLRPAPGRSPPRRDDSAS